MTPCNHSDIAISSGIGRRMDTALGVADDWLPQHRAQSDLGFVSVYCFYEREQVHISGSANPRHHTLLWRTQLAPPVNRHQPTPTAPSKRCPLMMAPPLHPTQMRVTCTGSQKDRQRDCKQHLTH